MIMIMKDLQCNDNDNGNESFQLMIMVMIMKDPVMTPSLVPAGTSQIQTLAMY